MSRYVGGELELFADAENWKRYFGRFIRPHLRGRVLEVGAGIGATAAMLAGADETEWVCLEPDSRLADRLQERVNAGELPRVCRVQVGTTAELSEAAAFDTVLYVDVLEHIEDDAAELLRAADLLAPRGRLVVLAPAHQALFSPFDAAIGHHRRYDRQSLQAAAPAAVREEQILYLDAAGLLLSGANRMLLRQSMPTARQVMFWDRRVIPVSRIVDPIAGFRLGKTIVGVWRR